MTTHLVVAGAILAQSAGAFLHQSMGSSNGRPTFSCTFVLKSPYLAGVYVSASQRLSTPTFNAPRQDQYGLNGRLPAPQQT